MNEKARNQLLDKGLVYTLRQSRHIEGLDWCTDKRGGFKLCNVRIEYVTNGRYSLLYLILSDYVKDSGFDSVEEWLKTYNSYNHSPKFYLYRVIKMN